MTGVERTLFPRFAETKFGVASKTAILSFITAFGVTKTIADYYKVKPANTFGRKNLHLLGRLPTMPIPFMLIYAPNRRWVIGAKVLLGVSQELSRSSTLVMKIDLVGKKNGGWLWDFNVY